MRPYTYIEDQSALERLCQNIPESSLPAVDTEFVRESTYFPHLCLIQVAGEGDVACIDCVARIDLNPLFEALFSASIGWIVHSARQDLEIFWHAAGRVPQGLIDTQIAAALLGYAPQVGLQDIVRSVLGVELDKSHTRTKWDKRPLNPDALAYAADDVRYLEELWNRLESELAAKGRAAWLHEDCQRLLAQPLVHDTLALYQRLKGAGGLRGPAVPAALSLLDWREQRAQRADRPRKWIMADAVLVRLARERPSTRAALQSFDGLSPRTASKAGDSILEAIERCGNPEFKALAKALDPEDAPDPKRLKSLQDQVARKARELGIAAEVVAAKRDLAAVVLGRPPRQLTSGWRAELLALDEKS